MNSCSNNVKKVNISDNKITRNIIRKIRTDLVILVLFLFRQLELIFGILSFFPFFTMPVLHSPFPSLSHVFLFISRKSGRSSKSGTPFYNDDTRKSAAMLASPLFEFLLLRCPIPSLPVNKKKKEENPEECLLSRTCTFY